MSRAPLDPSVSHYLDLSRILAALLVVLHHVFEPPFHQGELTFPGRAAVIVFFVISGFVIAYSSHGQPDWQLYAVARLARIYSVAVPALTLSVGLVLAQEAWPGAPSTSITQPSARFVASLLFVNQFWNLSIAALTNGPYWSLCYEVWYYVMFGVAIYTRGASRVAALGVLALLVGPRILLLMPVWAIGVATFHLMRSGPSLPPAFARPLFWAFAAGAVWCIGYGTPLDSVSASISAALVDGYWQIGDFRAFIGGDARFLSDWFLGLVFAGSVWCSRGMWSKTSSVSQHWQAFVQACSSYTFSLYLYHAPVLVFAHAVLAGSLPKAVVPWAMLLLISVSVALLGRVTEHRKDPWVRLFNALLRRQARSSA